MNYISSHIEDAVMLDDIANHAGISKFHFHRLFRAFVGESIGEFQRRVRLERATTMLLYHEDKPIKEVAFESGFSTSQNFAKLFKKQYGITPQEYRIRTPKFVNDKNSKIGNINHGQHSYYCIDNNVKNDASMNATPKENVSIEQVPEQLVLFVRKQGEYSYKELAEIYSELFRTAETLPIKISTDTVIGMVWDLASITKDSHCRYDACVQIPAEIKLPSHFNTQILPSGKYAIYKCKVENYNFYYHWQRCLTVWLPQSGYTLDNRPSREVFRDVHNQEHGVFLLEIWLPIQ